MISIFCFSGRLPKSKFTALQQATQFSLLLLFPPFALATRCSTLASLRSSFFLQKKHFPPWVNNNFSSLLVVIFWFLTIDCMESYKYCDTQNPYIKVFREIEFCVHTRIFPFVLRWISNKEVSIGIIRLTTYQPQWTTPQTGSYLTGCRFSPVCCVSHVYVGLGRRRKDRARWRGAMPLIPTDAVRSSPHPTSNE